MILKLKGYYINTDLINQTELHKVTGLSQSYISQIFHGKKRINHLPKTQETILDGIIELYGDLIISPSNSQSVKHADETEDYPDELIN